MNKQDYKIMLIEMNKQDYKIMFSDSLFWFVVVFAFVCLVAVAPFGLMLVLLLLVLAGTFGLILVAAYKMYKLNKYWHYNKD